MVKIPTKNRMPLEEQYGACKNREPGKFSKFSKFPTGENGENRENGEKEARDDRLAPPEVSKRLDTWLDNFDVMRRLHISQRTLQTLRSNGKLPFTKLGNKCYYREQDLQMLMMESYRDGRVKFRDTEEDKSDSGKKGGGLWP